MISCPHCGSQNPEPARFCIECGTAFSVVCPQCGAGNPPRAKFCAQCGARLTAGKTLAPDASRAGAKSAPRMVERPPAPNDELPQGERKTVTALFADIKGSMELMEDLDPEAARALVDPALKLMIDAVHHYEGYVVQSTGDGVFALFGAPLAHEDHPQRALYAALRMQEQIKAHASALRQQGRPPIQIRVGLNCGEVVIRAIPIGEEHAEYTPIGHSTSLASRLQALAIPGTVVISEALRKLCEGYFTLKSLGAERIKGVSEPVAIFEVTGLGPLRTRLQRSLGRGLTRFVGRQAEIETLQRAAAAALAGHGQIVAAVAEAGIGKSRLFHEFKLAAGAGWMVLDAFSVSHGKASAYLPLIDLLRNYFNIVLEDDPRARREKVNGKVLTLDRALEDAVPYLLGMLGLVEGTDPLLQMDAQVRTQRTLEAIKRLLLRESLNQPLMVIVEDLHWLDDESIAWLNLFADSIATARVLLLVNYRPEHSHGWNNKTYYTQLRLDPLAEPSAEQLLDALLASDPLLPGQAEGRGARMVPLKRMILAKTGGNPFFIEETVQALFDEGGLVRNGAVKLARPLDELKIPATVQAVLSSRIDRLPGAEKDLLQTLAVIGKEFSVGLAGKLVGPATELDRMLSALQAGEFIYEQPSFPDTEYTFKHALTQEVAYNSVLIERRRALHERIGGAIEALYGDHLGDHLGEVAGHYRRSANAAKAVEYLKLAAKRAAQGGREQEAVGQLRAALEILKGIPRASDSARRELELQIALGVSLIPTAGFAAEELKAVNLRAVELSQEAGDPALRFSALHGLSIWYLTRGELAKALEVGATMIELAIASGNSPMIGAANITYGSTIYWAGDFRQSLTYLNVSEPEPTDPSAGALGIIEGNRFATASGRWTCGVWAFPTRRWSVPGRAWRSRAIHLTA
jgi:class 3 adenylate cyclase